MSTKRSVKLVIYSLNTAQFMNESTPIKGRPFSLHRPNTRDHSGRNAQRSRGSTGLFRWLQALIDTSCSDAGLSQAWTGSLEFRHGKSYVVRQWKMYLNWATIKIYSLTQYIYAKQQLYKVATTTSKILENCCLWVTEWWWKNCHQSDGSIPFPIFTPSFMFGCPLDHQNRVTRGSGWNLPLWNGTTLPDSHTSSVQSMIFRWMDTTGHF